MEVHLADIWELEGAPLPDPPPPLPCPGLSLGGRTLTLKETGVQGPKGRVSSPEELRLKAGVGGAFSSPQGKWEDAYHSISFASHNLEAPVTCSRSSLLAQRCRTSLLSDLSLPGPQSISRKTAGGSARPFLSH